MKTAESRRSRKKEVAAKIIERNFNFGITAKQQKIRRTVEIPIKDDSKLIIPKKNK